MSYEQQLDATFAALADPTRRAILARLATGTDVILDIGLMRRADRARVREIAEGADLPLQFHFVTASQQARRARVADRNVVRGESFAIEVTPELFEFIEGVFEPPEPAELEGAIISESR